MSTAEYQRQWRAKQGARTGRLGRPSTAKCGSVSGYRKHLRNKDQTCDACRQAWSSYMKEHLKQAKSSSEQDACTNQNGELVCRTTSTTEKEMP
jgi:hypothetical protein